MPAGFRYFVLVLFVLQLGVSGPAASTVGTATSDEQAMHALTMEALAHVRGVLKLDVDQVKQIQPLLAAHLKNFRRIFEEHAGMGPKVLPSLMREFEEARDNFRDELEPILTQKQMEGVAVLRKEVDDSIRSLVVDQRVAILKSHLGLSDEQLAEVTQIIGSDFDRKIEIIAMHNTTDAGNTKAHQVLTSEIRKIQDETKKRLEAILTGEQIKAYETYARNE